MYRKLLIVNFTIILLIIVPLVLSLEQTYVYEIEIPISMYDSVFYETSMTASDQFSSLAKLEALYTTRFNINLFPSTPINRNYGFSTNDEGNSIYMYRPVIRLLEVAENQ